MLMALGPFIFTVTTQLLDTLTDRESARIEQMERAAAMPTPQFLGPGDREIEITALIYKEVLSPGGPFVIEAMRLALRAGLRMPLIARAGHFYGFFLIRELEVVKTHVLPNGTFQKMEVRISLTRSPLGFGIGGISLF
ncbi:phage tail protein [Rhodobacter capsulatus]|uniref:Phage P2 GpU n=1 Tax=Rhodobacter capsulatus TaxID=1061 RepID=A0A1G7PUT3_RHOCA|nr:phage tail protein [Rhodobacter capsulatus]WER10168.1 phage tail protein [Rhodobacter capsulatus]SDF90082.1 Phage P2 GpU [Rhodobacter capsulatus]